MLSCTFPALQGIKLIPRVFNERLTLSATNELWKACILVARSTCLSRKKTRVSCCKNKRVFESPFLSLYDMFPARDLRLIPREDLPKEEGNPHNKPLADL